MTKTELIAKMAEKAEVTKKVAEDVLDAFTNTVIEALKEEDKVALSGFGTFEVRNRAARTARNPRTGEAIEIPEQKTPAFKAGKNLKESVK